MAGRARDVRRDSFDFRDLIYRPALVELPDARLPRWDWLHILDQRDQGACTGFGLAAVVNYLAAHKRGAGPSRPALRYSARMLFEMARRYDQWPGERYDWSSPRGAMKGWFKHGVCTEDRWPNHPAKGVPAYLTRERQLAAIRCPLGAYYRVLPQRTDVHAALMETGVVYAAAATHAGWDAARGRPVIAWKRRATGGDGHAFAIVGYTPEGFLVQNSWGPAWGGFVAPGSTTRRRGVALWLYEDFDANVWDLWVARTALPVESVDALGRGRYAHGPSGTRVQEAGPPAHEIWGRFVNIDDGHYVERGDYATTAAEIGDLVDRLVNGDLTDGMRASTPKHLVLFAHGGLNSVDAAAMRVAKWRPVLERNRIAGLHFIWHTGLLAELKDILVGKEAQAKDRVAGGSDTWDRIVEKLSQPLGHPVWREIQGDARAAFDTNAAAAGTHFLAALVQALRAAGANAPHVHLACHSAGSIWMTHLLERWRALEGPRIGQLLLFAPACTRDLFFDGVVPKLKGRHRLVDAVHHFQLDDGREQDDNVAQVYRKSLLYLVARAYEDRRRQVPILGMAANRADVERRLKAEGVASRVTTYDPAADPLWTGAGSHGGFDNDRTTMNAMLRLVLGKDPGGMGFADADLKGY